MSKAKAKHNTRSSTSGKLARAPDRALIALMLKYGAAIGTALTAYKLEPGGDCDRSAPVAERAFRRARECLAFAAARPAQTMEGLSAKARAVPFVFQEREGAAFDDVSRDFLKSLAADAKRLAEDAMRTERADAKGGAA